MAGRVALVSSVIYGSLLHSFIVYKWPMSLLCFLVRAIHNFVWTGSISSKILVMVQWDDCCRPKEEGGIGLKRLHHLNSALLCKLAECSL